MYEDIIRLPHHISKTRRPMSMMDRAAQFSPFAALTGYDAAIRETGRLTERKRKMDTDAQSLLDRKLRMLVDHLADEPEVTFTCFMPDGRKAGGAYAEVTGAVKSVDGYERRIVMRDGTGLPMDDILDVEGELFAAIAL